MLNERCVGYGSRDFLEYNLKLNEICPEIFPNLTKLRKNDLSLLLPSKNYDKFKTSAFHGKTSMKIHVRPKKVEVCIIMINLSEVFHTNVKISTFVAQNFVSKL